MRLAAGMQVFSEKWIITTRSWVEKYFLLSNCYVIFAAGMITVAEEKIMISENWQEAWQLKGFRTRFITGILMLLATFAYLPFFFKKIEKRDGVAIADRLLEVIQARDVSLIIFICIWGITLLLFLRCLKKPMMFIVTIYGFVVLYMMRLMTITLIPLNPPSGLIPLVDPLSNMFYGKGTFITKDLFFSGHTSCQFIAFLCFHNKRDKILALISTFIVGTLVLVQHVHYTVDVVAAIPLTFICYILGRQIALRGWGKNP